MKVAVVHSFYSSSAPSGENTVVRMQVDALEAAGHDVLLVAAYTDELASRPLYPIKAGIGIVTGRGIDPTEQLLSFGPDVIHIHNLFPNFSTRWIHDWPGAIVSTVHNFRPVCASGILYRDGTTCTLCPDGSQMNAIRHGCYRGSRLASLPLAIRNRGGVNADPVLARSDNVIFLSGRSRDQYLAFGYRQDSSYVVPNFVEASKKPLPAVARRDEWIYVGRLAPEKGILQLLESWPGTETIDVYGDGPLAVEVAQMASQNIKFHGPARRESLLQLMPGAKGMMIPSTCAENFPTVYAEALAAGLPVVAKTGNSAADDVAASGVGAVFDDWCDVPGALSQVKSSHESMSDLARQHFDTSFTVTPGSLEQPIYTPTRLSDVVGDIVCKNNHDLLSTTHVLKVERIVYGSNPQKAALNNESRRPC